MMTALVGLSLPDFWLGLVAIYVFAVALGWFPTGGYVPFSDRSPGLAAHHDAAGRRRWPSPRSGCSPA